MLVMITDSLAAEEAVFAALHGEAIYQEILSTGHKHSIRPNFKSGTVGKHLQIN